MGFGSFGVPIKSDRADKVDVDPLVMQTYKSILSFLLSFTVLLVGVEFSFTPWGIVSGLFWVPSGTAVVYGIRNLGLAPTVGVNSSLIVLVSFTWGIFIFDEHVRSRLVACLAILLLILGIWGMVYFSQPHLQTRKNEFSVVGPIESNNDNNIDSDEDQNHIDNDEDQIYDDQLMNYKDDVACWGSAKAELVVRHLNNIDEFSGIPTHQMSWRTTTSDEVSSTEPEDEQITSSSSSKVLICGKYWTRRNLGIACVVFNGLWVRLRQVMR